MSDVQADDEPSDLLDTSNGANGDPAPRELALEPPEPLHDPADHLDLLVRRFAGRLERHRYQRDASHDAAGRLFTTERRLAELDARLAARVAVSGFAALPIMQLQHRFGLSDLAIDFLVGAA